ncbi:MAG: hypothetical protein K2O12_05130, partial [Muribaculaceae bacterium]|nr:hypothetical protein [Muribaculaceae bacterium]
LPSEFYNVPIEILERAVLKFKADYDRWFPDGKKLTLLNLLLTPQLIAVLCYRIAQEIRSLLPPPPRYWNQY